MVDKQFFEKYQKQLVWIFNTDIGRWFFRIGKNYSGIQDEDVVIAVYPSCIKWRRPNGDKVSEFRTNPRFAYRLNTLLKLVPFLRWERDWVPQLQMGLTVSEFMPDPDPESTTVDGEVGREAVDQTFSDIRSGAGTVARPTSANISVLVQGSTTTDQYQALRRLLWVFDTSAIEDTDTLNSARLRLYGQGKDNGLSGESSANSVIVVVSSTPASNTDLVAGDYSQTGSTDFGRSVQQDSWDTTGYNNITLNASGISNISKTGVSKFGGRYGWDFDNTTTGLTWASAGLQAVTHRSADTAGTTQDPILEVTHSAATTTTTSTTSTTTTTTSSTTTSSTTSATSSSSSTTSATSSSSSTSTTSGTSTTSSSSTSTSSTTTGFPFLIPTLDIFAIRPILKITR